MKSTKVLDCTLRDGGYQNNWDFSSAFISDYIETISKYDIDVVELGYRDVCLSKSKGRFANCSDEFIDRLDLPKTVDYAIMLDAKNIFSSEEQSNLFFKDMMRKKQFSPVDIIRIAVNYSDVSHAIPMIQRVASLGYRVFLNLMQVTTADLAELALQCKKIETLDAVEAVYFGDSFGCMSPLDIPKVISAMRSSWSGDIGFHGHNNKGLALMNAIEAIDEGACWIDSTIRGMGRGAGNVSTEMLLQETAYGDNNFDGADLDRLISKHFTGLSNKYKWGPNLYYYIAAERNIHPMYIQQLLNKYNFEKNEMKNILAVLSSKNAAKYDNDVLTYCVESQEVMKA